MFKKLADIKHYLMPFISIPCIEITSLEKTEIVVKIISEILICIFSIYVILKKKKNGNKI